ncbi:glycosyltransferase family 4 protein [Mycobacterium sp. 155]|uniref:glycosyltransferase family 4 protein n=1 Tax=Mycobacterium sp. 155 TaxID=1157943 RepID=UPI000373D042|nr:glycosyltransferase family 4 protein [Mycobacterium sp. 155]
MTEVAIVSAVNPYPADDGKKVVLGGLIDYFTTRLCPQRVHYLLVANRAHGDFGVNLRSFKGPSAAQACRNVATRTLVGRSSIQESLLWSRGTEQAVQRSLREIDPQIELYDTVRAAQYADNAPGPTRICYIDDLFSERYATMLEASKTDRSVTIKPLANFAKHVPAKLRFLSQNRIPQRVLLTAEKRLIARSEDRTARSVDQCLLVNHYETELLQKRAAVGEGRISTIPPLIKEPTTVSRNFQGSPEFLFLGLLSAPHNDEGLRSFICDTWPKVLSRIPNARLRVVGREPQPELLAAIASFGSGSISLEGYVPDLDTLMAQSAAILNPMRFGSGVKIKILESLGRGLPVVSTTIGARGVLAGIENGVCLADDTDEWVEQLGRLTSPKYNSMVSMAASEHFEQTYSKNVVFAAYDRIFGLG